MTDSGVNSGEADAPIPSPTPSFDPFFKMWSDWLSNSMGPMTTVPAASLPWLAKPGVSTGEEAEPFPSGAMANDPLLSALDKFRQDMVCQPLQQYRAPRLGRDHQVAADPLDARDIRPATGHAGGYGLQPTSLYEVSRGMDRRHLTPLGAQQEKEKEGRPSDPRFSAPEWDSNPFYAMLAAVYHTQDTQV
jgi:hypothetical protein